MPKKIYFVFFTVYLVQHHRSDMLYIALYNFIMNVLSCSLHCNTCVGTREHQNIQIGVFECLIRFCPDDPSIVQGFCEV